MEFNSENITANPAENSTNQKLQTNSTSKLISAITDFIPAFFSPNGVLLK